MTAVIVSKVIGQLTRDTRFDDWWDGANVAIPFFDGLELPISFIDYVPEADAAFMDEADAALRNFLTMTRKDRLTVSSLVYENCLETVDATDYPFEEDVPLRAMTDPTEVWNFVMPTRIYLSRRHRRDKDVYLRIACNCTWEEEHGLQLVFRQGKKLTRVSPQDGHVTEADAYDIPDEDDPLLAAF